MFIIYTTIVSFFRDENYRNLLYATFVILAIGTVAYHHLEGWTWIDSAYFSVVTLTTIGYGDFTPKTDIGKLFTIGYIFLGIGIILSFINTVYNHYAQVNSKKKNN